MAATFKLNGQEAEFEPGQTILEAAQAAGVYIPTLCYLKDTTPTGACRICLVEVKGARSLAAACALPASPGLEAATDTPRVAVARKLNLELLLASGQHDCVTCEADGACRLQELCYKYGVEQVRFPRPKAKYPPELGNPLIIRDFSRCVRCGRCIQACNEVQVNRAISQGYRGARSKVVTGGDQPLVESDCVFCGQCVQACPVGALVEKKAKGLGRAWELKKVRTTCTYCGVGCQLWLHVKDGRIVKVSGVEEARPNLGRLCVKGRYGYDFICSQERLTTPLIRHNGSFREASWDEALDLVADRLREVKAKHGPDALAGVSCARSVNEDSYNMQKLFRESLGTNNIDHCART
jgi:formate dehydrogenase major subunit